MVVSIFKMSANIDRQRSEELKEKGFVVIKDVCRVIKFVCLYL